MTEETKIDTTDEMQIVAITKLTQTVSAWKSEQEAPLMKAALEAKAITLAGATDPKDGYKVVRTTRLGLREKRLAVEKWHENTKGPITAAGRLVDGIKNELVGIVKGEETRLKAEEDAYEAEQERLKKEAEAEKKKKLAARIDCLTMHAVQITSDILAAAEVETDEEWGARVEAAAEAKRKADEAEELRQKALEAFKERCSARRAQLKSLDATEDDETIEEASDAEWDLLMEVHAEAKKVADKAAADKKAADDAKAAEEARKAAADAAELAELRALKKQQDELKAAEATKLEPVLVEAEPVAVASVVRTGERVEVIVSDEPAAPVRNDAEEADLMNLISQLNRISKGIDSVVSGHAWESESGKAVADEVAAALKAEISKQLQRLS